MRSKGRLILAGLVAAALAVSLFGCMGNWFTQTQTASLIIGNPVISGTTGMILVSVTSMPNNGLASLAVRTGGLTLLKDKVANVKVTGLNGFTVLAQDFNQTTGALRFVVANANAGSVGGTVAEVAFTGTGTITSGDIKATAADIQLGSAGNALITAWQLVAGQAYYAK